VQEEEPYDDMKAPGTTSATSCTGRKLQKVWALPQGVQHAEDAEDRAMIVYPLLRRAETNSFPL